MLFLSSSYMLNHDMNLGQCHVLEAPASSTSICSTCAITCLHLGCLSNNVGILTRCPIDCVCRSLRAVGPLLAMH